MIHSSPTLLIRADAHVRTGTGHVMRCLALAQAWRASGGRAIFLTARNLPALKNRIRKEGFRVVSMAVAPGGSADAKLTAGHAKKHGAQWVAVDGYHFHSTFRKVLRNNGCLLLWIDDLGTSGEGFADMVVNQNLHAKKSLYPKCSPRTRLLLGPSFALLRKEFVQAGSRTHKAGPRPRLLISGGGTDPHNMTKTALEALSHVSNPSFEIEVILGPGYKKEKTLKNLLVSTGIHRVHVRRNPSHMARLMARADLAVVSAGSTCWEISRLGLPALLVEQADNQVRIARSLHRAGVAWNLGPAAGLREKSLQRRLQWLADSPDVRRRMSSRGRLLIDGRGATRVVKAMMAKGVP